MNRISLFNINISTLKFSDYIQKSITQKNGYSCFLNSHMLYEHYRNPFFSNVLSAASFVLPDGVPMLCAMRCFNKISQRRIAGNDVIYALIESAKQENLRVFLFGSTELVLQKMSKRLADSCVIHSTYSPPFVPVERFDFVQQASVINSFEPDMVLVGLGCPKQEIWMYRMKDKIKAPMFGLGGAFLLYAGVDSRAPKWMRDIGLEWVYRLALEPKRLFKRYFVTNSFFIYLVAKELIKKVFRVY